MGVKGLNVSISFQHLRPFLHNTVARKITPCHLRNICRDAAYSPFQMTRKLTFVSQELTGFEFARPNKHRETPTTGEASEGVGSTCNETTKV